MFKVFLIYLGLENQNEPTPGLKHSSKLQLFSIAFPCCHCELRHHSSELIMLCCDCESSVLDPRTAVMCVILGELNTCSDELCVFQLN